MYNKDKYESFLKSRFTKLDAIAKKHPEQRGDLPEVHILVGQILGYVCPSDPTTWWEGNVDDISYVIDGKTYMGVWCTSKKTTKEKAKRLLVRMNRALALIGKKAELVIKKKLGGGYTRKRRD